ncbi:MAG: hypothetical protein AB7E32_09935 [Desulfovibrio sp.]
MEQMLFLQYLLFGLGVLAILALAVPLLIWRNTSETARLLNELLEAQETTNALLAKLLRGMNALEAAEIGAPGPDDDYGPDEEYCPGPDGESYEPCAPNAETADTEAENAETEEGSATAKKNGPDSKGDFWIE